MEPFVKKSSSVNDQAKSFLSQMYKLKIETTNNRVIVHKRNAFGFSNFKNRILIALNTTIECRKRLFQYGVPC